MIFQDEKLIIRICHYSVSILFISRKSVTTLSPTYAQIQCIGISDVERNSFLKSGRQLICSERESILPIRNR